MRSRTPTLAAIALTACALFAGFPAARAQIIDFESGGLKYKALTHNAVTVMFAQLPIHVRDYAIMQVSIANGSKISWSIRPEDFKFERADGTAVTAEPAETVIHDLIKNAGRSDATKLIAAYEAGLYGMPNVHSTNGYETRRQNALGDGSNKIKAAAAASAIALVRTKLQPGQSTDGAVFYVNQGKPLGGGKLIVNTAGDTYEFPIEEAHATK